MKKTVFTGAGVAIVTPMREDGSVHYEKLGELLDWQINEAPTPSSSPAPPANPRFSTMRSIARWWIIPLRR